MSSMKIRKISSIQCILSTSYDSFDMVNYLVTLLHNVMYGQFSLLSQYFHLFFFFCSPCVNDCFSRGRKRFLLTPPRSTGGPAIRRDCPSKHKRGIPLILRHVPTCCTESASERLHEFLSIFLPPFERFLLYTCEVHSFSTGSQLLVSRAAQSR